MTDKFNLNTNPNENIEYELDDPLGLQGNYRLAIITRVTIVTIVAMLLRST